MNDNNYCVILAGGVGLRLWPCSRHDCPKQFIDLIGSGESLLQTTYKRFKRIIRKENILVVTNSNYYEKVKEQLPELSDENTLLEPIRRNTVASVIWAAEKIRNVNPDATLVVTPVDQMIVNDKNFEDDILMGMNYAANNNSLLTLGVVPSRPDTTYGYIQMAEQKGADIYKVKSFTEKPELEFAKMFVENREFLWNTGLFIWSAQTFLNTISAEVPEYAQFVQLITNKSQDVKLSADNSIDKTYSTIKSDTIETGVLEKVSNVDVLLCHFTWADIGTWESLFNVLPKDKNSNVLIESKTMLYNSKDCIVKLSDGKVAFIEGLEGYLVAEEGNVLVICKKDNPEIIRRFAHDAQLNFGEEYT